MGEELLKTGEAAEYVKLHREHLLRLRRQGKVEARRIGPKGTYRWRRSDLDQLLVPTYDEAAL